MTLPLALALVVSSAAPPAVAPKDPVFVQADVARLRAAPSEAGAVVARLRIGARLEVVAEEGAWIRVASATGHDGWVAREALAGTAPTLAAALREAKRARGADRVRWLERAAALEPARRATWVELRAALGKAGQEERAAFVGSLLEGRAPVRVAACYKERWILLADLVPGRALAPEIAEPREAPQVQAEDDPDAREAARLERLGVELSGVAWFAAGASGAARAIAPERIRPSVERSDTVLGAIHRLQLGACGPGDRLAFSQPVARAAEAGFGPAFAPGRWSLAVAPAFEEPGVDDTASPPPAPEPPPVAEGEEGAGAGSPPPEEEDGHSWTNGYEVRATDGGAPRAVSITVDIWGC